jgi:uncharacterized membrane protein YhaH (DUF805 family)
MDWNDYFFSFEGRAPRWEYWLFVGISLGYTLLALIIALTIQGWNPAAFARLTPIMFVLTLPLYWPGFAITVRRLHDRNKSDERAWFFLGTPLLGNLISWLLPPLPASLSMFVYLLLLLLLQFAILVVSLWALIELGFLRGTTGDNRFGPDLLPPDIALPDGSGFRQALPAGGHRVRLIIPAPNGAPTQEFYYVAESDPERARTIIRDAKNARDGDVKTLDTILHQTVETLNLKPGEFVPVPRVR